MIRTVLKGALVCCGLFAIGGGTAGLVMRAQEEPFPHEAHQGLFPVCAGCHEGVELGDEDGTYPDPVLCSRCHDGEREDSVDWQGPTRPVSNVRYSHTEHATLLEEAGDPPQGCEACHSADPTRRMTVDAEEEMDTCLSCHAHEADEHFERGAECSTCHVPLAGTGFGAARITALPRPPEHDDPLFVAELHGEASSGFADRCATCHTRDRCLTCHVDGSLVEIQAIDLAPEDMTLPAAEPEYPTPPSHVDEGWLDAHKLQVPVRECSTCHTQDDCVSCHVGIVPTAVEALPRRDDVIAPGVGLETHSPESHASIFFLDTHPLLAASDSRSCAVCHTESYCVECHDGAADGGYHPPSFVSRHAADAFGRTTECATCHSTEVFCRACHEDVGLTASGRLQAGYHDAEPIWLLRHGQSARQNLESCASCHRQTDCVQCHGVLGSFSVSPHSRDFDPVSAWERSPRTCLACHVRNPVGGEP